MPELPQPQTAAGRDALATLLAAPARALVAVDYDGTLAPIVTDPDRAAPFPGAIDSLVAIAETVGTVAIVTGRPAEVVVRLSGVQRALTYRPDASIVVLGQYGLQRWDSRTGRLRSPAASDGVAAARAELPKVLADAGVADARVEDKGLAFAVHTRPVAEPQRAFERLQGPLSDLAARHDLRAEIGRLVVELRPTGMDKGHAVRSVAADAGAGVVVFVGDDSGDLPAYDAVEALRSEGVAGLLVCSVAADGEGPPELRQRADLLVNGPAGVAELLAGLATALSTGPSSQPPAVGQAG